MVSIMIELQYYDYYINYSRVPQQNNLGHLPDEKIIVIPIPCMQCGMCAFTYSQNNSPPQFGIILAKSFFQKEEPCFLQ